MKKIILKFSDQKFKKILKNAEICNMSVERFVKYLAENSKIGEVARV